MQRHQQNNHYIKAETAAFRGQHWPWAGLSIPELHNITVAHIRYREVYYSWIFETQDSYMHFCSSVNYVLYIISLGLCELLHILNLISLLFEIIFSFFVFPGVDKDCL